MKLLLLTACIGMAAGFFILLRLSPLSFTEGIFSGITGKSKSLREEIMEVTRRKKNSYLRRELVATLSALDATGRLAWFPALCAVSLLLLAAGSSLALLLGNFFLLPVLAVGMMMLPFWYIRLSQVNFKKDIAAELETALSMITTAYLRNDDILTAVEESIAYLNPPASVVFRAFLSRVKLVDPDITAALLTLKEQIQNEVFREWCEALIGCQDDRGLKSTLPPIVSKLSDMRVVNGELENLVFSSRKEFITMLVLVVGNIPLLYFLNQDWYHTLMHTVPGQIVLAVCAAAIFISTAFVIKLTQPIEYRR